MGFTLSVGNVAENPAALMRSSNDGVNEYIARWRSLANVRRSLASEPIVFISICFINVPTQAFATMPK